MKRMTLFVFVCLGWSAGARANDPGNLFANAGFEERNPVANMLRPNHWFLGWVRAPTPYSQHVVAVDNPHARTGQGAVRLQKTAVYQHVQLEADKTYTLSCYARYAGGPRARMAIRTIGPRPMDRYTEVDLNGDEWTMVTDTLEPPETRSYPLGFYPAGSEMKVDVDDAQVRVGQATARKIKPARPHEHILPRFVDAYKSQKILRAHPDVFSRWARLMKAESLGGAALDDLIDVADLLLQMRDDYRGQQAYRKLSHIKDMNPATRTLVTQRLAMLEGHLRLRKEHEQTSAWLPVHYPYMFPKPAGSPDQVKPFMWAQVKPSADWDTTLDEAYYFPWQSLAYLTVHVK